MFSSLGVPVFDADQIGRDLLAPGTDLTRQVLESVPACADGQAIDRKKLAALVFSNPSLRTWLEDLLHPAICAEYQQKLRLLQRPRSVYALLEGAVFLESHAQASFPLRGLVIVTAPLATRLQRLQLRDGSDVKQLQSRIAAQMPQEQKILFATHLIENSGTPGQTQSNVELVAKCIIDECGGNRS
jgi:dephospho-CoA kinase